MPCYSSIRTMITDGVRLEAALLAMGYVVSKDGLMIKGKRGESGIWFNKKDDVYMAGGDTDELAGISKKYAELGVRAWAKRSGYSVIENDGTKMELLNRRK